MINFNFNGMHETVRNLEELVKNFRGIDGALGTEYFGEYNEEWSQLILLKAKPEAEQELLKDILFCTVTVNGVDGILIPVRVPAKAFDVRKFEKKTADKYGMEVLSGEVIIPANATAYLDGKPMRCEIMPKGKKLDGLFNQFTEYDATDFADAVIDDGEIILKDIKLREGRQVMIAALGGTGKTWLTYEIALALANGTELFSDKKINEPKKVAILDAEIGAKQVAKRIQALIRGSTRTAEKNMLKVISGGSGGNCTTPEFQEAFKEMFKDTDVIIVDSLLRFFKGADANADSDANHLSSFRAWCQSNDKNIIWIHHQGKSSSLSKNRSTSAKNSTSLTDNVSAYFELRLNSDGSRTLTSAKNNDDPTNVDLVTYKMDWINNGMVLSKTDKVIDTAAENSKAVQSRNEKLAKFVKDLVKTNSSATIQNIYDDAKNNKLTWKATDCKKFITTVINEVKLEGELK